MVVVAEVEVEALLAEVEPGSSHVEAVVEPAERVEVDY